MDHASSEDFPLIPGRDLTPEEIAWKHSVSAAGYKYREVVRKKADREQLQGFACQECEGFYRAVQSWGMANCQLPTCGHPQGRA